MQVRHAVLFLLVCQCYKRVGGERTATSAASVSAGAVQCSETAGSLTIAIATPAYFLNGSTLETPGVALRQGDTLLTLGAHWQSGNGSVVAELPTGLAAGAYDVILSRSSGDPQTLPAALTIAAAPQITSLSATALCEGAPQSLHVTGSNLQHATVMLSPSTHFICRCSTP